MSWLREHKILTIIISIFSILIIIIAISYNNIGSSTSLGRGVQKVIALVQGPVSGAGNGVRSGFKGIFQFRSILQENEELKVEISDLNRKLIKAKLNEAELAELRNLSNILGYENVTANYSYVTADVVAMDGSNWFNLFTINAGSNDGIKKDSVVINGDGLIGRVLEVGTDWSKVISVIDESNSVSFKVFRDTELLGILTGDGKGALEGYMIDPEATVIEGDVLISSGMGLYPEGIPIGKIKKVTWNNDTLLKTVTIEPSAYFNNLQKVAVLVLDK